MSPTAPQPPQPPAFALLLRRVVAPAAPVLVAWASTRLSDALWIRVLLSVLCGMAIILVPFFVSSWLSRRVPLPARVLMTPVIAVLLGLFFSLLHLKHLHLSEAAEGPSHARSVELARRTRRPRREGTRGDSST